MYLIAQDKETGLLSWIFLDILSNTIISIPSKAIADPNCKEAVFTTNGKMRKLDRPIWVMGNTSIGHCKHLTDADEHPFAQHYVADSPGCRTRMKDQTELIGNYNKLGDLGKIKTFSAKTVKNLLFFGYVGFNDPANISIHSGFNDTMDCGPMDQNSSFFYRMGCSPFTPREPHGEKGSGKAVRYPDKAVVPNSVYSDSSGNGGSVASYHNQ